MQEARHCVDHPTPTLLFLRSNGMIHNRVNQPLFHNCSQSTSEQKKCKQEQRTLHQWLNSLPRRWRGENGGSFSDDIHDVVNFGDTAA
jgi:hypothetical protein